MKVLIIGGTSSIGIAIKSLIAEYCEVITAGRKNCDIALDLYEPVEHIIIPENIDVIIHTAANFGGQSDSEILDAEVVNVIGTLKLCQAAVKAKTQRLILVSSISAKLKNDSPYFGFYALSKRQSEEVCELYCKMHSLSLTILRPSQVYGNDSNINKHQPLMNNIIEKAEKDENIFIYGSHDAVRNYIHIDDLKVIISYVIQKNIVGTYSCANTKNVRVTEIAEAALKSFKSNAKVQFDKEKSDILDNIFEEENSLYEKIGFYPTISIEEGMNRIAKAKKETK